HTTCEQGITDERREATPSPGMQAEPAQIKPCLMNVVLNAIQAMPAGGRLRITTQHCAEARSEGQAPEPHGTVEVTISDTGSGISEEDLNRIFKPYFTTKKLGIGLGLAITNKTMEEHRGRIDVRSRPHEGNDVVLR